VHGIPAVVSQNRGRSCGQPLIKKDALHAASM
jgi:hypothetical protein